MEEKYWLRTVLFLSAIMHKKCTYAQEIQTFQFLYIMSTWFIFCNGQGLLVRKGNKETNIISKLIVVCKIVPVMH